MCVSSKCEEVAARDPVCNPTTEQLLELRTKLLELRESVLNSGEEDKNIVNLLVG